MENNESENKPDDKMQKKHLSPVITALFIGFLIGIVVYSAVVSSWGIFTLIPVYFIYRLLKSKSEG